MTLEDMEFWALQMIGFANHLVGWLVANNQCTPNSLYQAYFDSPPQQQQWSESKAVHE